MIEIKELSKGLLEDYIYFFDEVAFSRDPEWAGCFCVWYHWDDALEADRAVKAESISKEYKKNYAIKLINEGRLRGYLAYENNRVVGWCNVNDRSHYVRLNQEKRPDLWSDYREDQKVRSIVCFTIAPDMRRKGISTLLLAKADEDSRRMGYSYLEAYPDLCTHGYHGKVSQFEAKGFINHKTEGDGLVMRKYY